MNKNQYIRIEGTVEEIGKMETRILSIYYWRRKLEELELEGDENVLIYSNEKGDGEEFINIYSKIRIMITDRGTIEEDKYKKLPKNIEYVIVENMIYDVKEELDMMYYMKKDTLKEKIREIIGRGIYNDSSMNGNTALMAVSYHGLEDEIKELNRMMRGEMISKWNKYGYTALMMICRNGMEEIGIEMIEKMNEEAINKCNKEGETALHWTSRNNMEKITIKLLGRMDKKTVCKASKKDGLTALDITTEASKYDYENREYKKKEKMRKEIMKKINSKKEEMK